MMRTVVFDLDGTLADTSEDLIAAGNAALVAMGYAAVLVPGADDATAFAGGRAMLRLGAVRVGVPEAEVAAMVERGYPILLEAYGAAIDVHTRLYPGAMAAVARLRGAGMRVSICTNKPEGLAVTLLERLGIAEAFDAMVGADSLPTRKPHAAPYVAAVERAGGRLNRSLLIGDTVTDRETARAAGVPSILVIFGPSGEKVAALAPDALLRHYDDLDAVVMRLLP